MHAPRIVVVGSINMDLVLRCARLPRPGETLLAESAAEAPGGKGANQAVAAAQLGADVAMIGRVGNDSFAKRLEANLDHNGVALHLARNDDCGSGLAIVAVERSGENSILVVPGANARLTPGDIDAMASVIGAADVLMLQLEIPLETVMRAMHLAREAGVRTILDPAPAPAHIPPGLLDVDVICPNQEEAAALVGQPVASRDDAERAARQLIHLGPRAAIITMGEQGAVLAQGDNVQWFAPFSVQAIDSTAAGDAFAGALAVRWAAGDTLGQATSYACAAGALAATQWGAQTSLPSLERVADLFAAGP